MSGLCGWIGDFTLTEPAANTLETTCRGFKDRRSSFWWG